MTDRFVDFTAVTDGSGSSGSPWNTLVGHSPSSSDVVWVRRAGHLTISSAFDFDKGCYYIGWPKAGDDLSFMPISVPSAPSGWGSDTNDYAEIQTSGSLTNITVSSAKIMWRWKFNDTSSTTNAVGFVHWTCATLYEPRYISCNSTNLAFNYAAIGVGSNRFRNCVFHSDSVTLATFKVPYPGASTQIVSPLFINCAFSNSSAANSTNAMVDVDIDTLSSVGFYKCSFTVVGNQPGVFLQNGAGGDRQTKIAFMDCIFDDSGRSGTSNGLLIKANCSSFARNAQINTKSGCRIGLSGSNRPSWWQFTKYTQVASFSPALDIQGPGTVVNVNNFSPNGSTTTPIALEQCSRLHMVNGTTSLRKNSIFIKDVGGTLESWKRIQSGGDCVKSSVNRTGGSAYSVQMTFDQDANEKRPIIFSDYGRETAWVGLQIGLRQLTVYIATKGYSSFTSDDFWFEFEYYGQPSSTHRATVSTRGYVLQSDSSTWTGDTGLTMYAISTQVLNKVAGIFPVRFFLRKYSPTAKVYLDPRVQVL